MLRTTSKRALLDSAMLMCEGDIDEASKLFDLYNERLQLPEEDAIQPSIFSQIKDNAVGLFGWLKENREDVIGVVDVIKNIVSKSGNAPTSQDAQSNINPLPKI